MEDDTVPKEEVKVLQEELIRSIYNDSPMLNDPEPCDIPGPLPPHRVTQWTIDPAPQTMPLPPLPPIRHPPCNIPGSLPPPPTMPLPPALTLPPMVHLPVITPNDPAIPLPPPPTMPLSPPHLVHLPVITPNEPTIPLSPPHMVHLPVITPNPNDTYIPMPMINSEPAYPLYLPGLDWFYVPPIPHPSGLYFAGQCQY